MVRTGEGNREGTSVTGEGEAEETSATGDRKREGTFLSYLLD